MCGIPQALGDAYDRSPPERRERIVRWARNALASTDDDIVINSGPIPERLRNKRLPDLPADIDPTVADLVVIAAMNGERIGLTAEEAARMGPAEARERLVAAYRVLGIGPLKGMEANR